MGFTEEIGSPSEIVEGLQRRRAPAWHWFLSYGTIDGWLLWIIGLLLAGVGLVTLALACGFALGGAQRKRSPLANR